MICIFTRIKSARSTVISDVEKGGEEKGRAFKQGLKFNQSNDPPRALLLHGSPSGHISSLSPSSTAPPALSTFPTPGHACLFSRTSSVRKIFQLVYVYDRARGTERRITMPREWLIARIGGKRQRQRHRVVVWSGITQLVLCAALLEGRGDTQTPPPHSDSRYSKYSESEGKTGILNFTDCLCGMSVYN